MLGAPLLAGSGPGHRRVAALGRRARTPTGVVLALRDRTIHRALAERAAERERLSAYGTDRGGHRARGEESARRDPRRRRDPRLAHERREVARDRGADRARSRSDPRARRRPARVPPARRAEARARNIHRVLDEVLELLSMDPIAAGVKLERSFDPSIPELRADPDRLTQVFLNLGAQRAPGARRRGHAARRDAHGARPAPALGARRACRPSRSRSPTTDPGSSPTCSSSSRRRSSPRARAAPGSASR